MEKLFLSFLFVWSVVWSFYVLVMFHHDSECKFSLSHAQRGILLALGCFMTSKMFILQMSPCDFNETEFLTAKVL